MLALAGPQLAPHLHLEVLPQELPFHAPGLVSPCKKKKLTLWLPLANQSFFDLTQCVFMEVKV